MATTYDLRGKWYHTVGRLTALRDIDFEQELARLNSRQTTEARAQFIIVGEGGGKKLERIEARGTRLITQDEVIAALDAGGLVELESTDISQIIGELRSLQSRTELSDSDRWLLCAELLDRCDDEQLPPVVQYARDAFLPTLETKQLWEPNLTTHKLLRGITPKWMRGCPKKQLLVAPPGWLREMAEGTYSPKHSLIRALNMDHLIRQEVQLKNVLKNPHLASLEFVNFGRKSYSPDKLLAKLDDFEAFHGVEVIWLYDIDKKLPGRLEKNEVALKNVHTITFHGCLQRYAEQDHYGSMSEEEGIAVIEAIEALPCFAKTPKINFRTVRGR